ncbi:MAG TPA: nucleotidyltransferase family protein [Puia sp.]|nr:nucleotidyltransferase family protein [Puia sp.]
MAIKEAIILAGGLGTRLRESVPDLPKCLAPVAGKPFLHYVIDHFKKQGIGKFIFATGYKSEMIETYLKSLSKDISWELSVERTPLGTGGAIKLACSRIRDQSALVLNGDTFFGIDLGKLSAFHGESAADCTLSLKPMRDFDRYGAVALNSDGSIKSFFEKKFYQNGLINGGIYALRVDAFLKEVFPAAFSFEKDYLEQFFNKRRIFGLVQDQYFIDIGIPADYDRAQAEWKQLIHN